MQKLRIVPLALALGLLLPAVPAFAAPAYTTQGSTTYFASTLASPLLAYPTASPWTPAFASGTTQPATSPSASLGYVSGSTTYFVPSLSDLLVQPSYATPYFNSVPSTWTSSGSATSLSTATSAGTGSATASGQTTVAPAPDPNASLAQQFLSLVNEFRAQNGVGTLADSPLLDQLALAKAQDMVEYGYVAHYSPRLGWPMNQETAAGFSAQSMGAENIAEAGTIQRAMIDLESDPGHRANLLDSAFTQTGIAVLPITGGVLVEELFAGPSY